MPKVSVIVPVYNTEKYIEKCLNSLVNQTLEDIEIIVVNDGSTDNSENVIKKYTEKYENIKYLKKQNGGLSSSRNYGLEYATGTYIGFVDSDDYVDTTMYEKLYEKAISTNSDIVECDFIWCYNDHKKLDTSPDYTNKDAIFAFGRVMVCNKIFKKQIIGQTKFPENLRYEDIVFYYKIIPYINQISKVKEPMYYYIQRNESISNLQNEKTKDIFKILENVTEFYKQNNIYDEYSYHLEYLYIRFLLGSSFLRMVKIKDKKIKQDLLEQTINFLYDTYPNWKENHILNKYKTLKNLYFKSVNKKTYKIYSKIFGLV